MNIGQLVTTVRRSVTYNTTNSHNNKVDDNTLPSKQSLFYKHCLKFLFFVYIVNANESGFIDISIKSALYQHEPKLSAASSTIRSKRIHDNTSTSPSKPFTDEANAGLCHSDLSCWDSSATGISSRSYHIGSSANTSRRMDSPKCATKQSCSILSAWATTAASAASTSTWIAILGVNGVLLMGTWGLRGVRGI